MKPEKLTVLAMNGGSSSIKFVLYTKGDVAQRRLHGKIDRIGLSGTTLTFNDASDNQHDSRVVGDFDQPSAANFLIDWLDQQNRVHVDCGGGPPHRRRWRPRSRAATRDAKLA